MTRAEAIRILRYEQAKSNQRYGVHSIDYFMSDNAFDMAIDALEQLSSYEQTINKLTDAISKQEPKTGHWINDEDTIGCYYCSECGGYTASYDDVYCKYCGAIMEESKDKSYDQITKEAAERM